MNVQNGNDLGLTGLASEYKRTSDTITQKNAIDQSTGETITEDKQVNNTQKLSENIVDHEPLNVEQLDKVAQQLQDFIGDLNRNIKFVVDEDSGRDVIKVIDKTSGDLIKQYPSEEVLTLVSKLSEMVGGFVDAKV
ncbi:flagellar protein FlaG [Colwellia sp. 4_MG-2023]|jgi:flagellar protein FlaG|uniref:flagellar protein FlaG n=1 Tax=unclassified Colwellia TaxID=196834 RepID=UPI001C094768|nr:MULTISPECIES: flagellar protein FlaG [unclassified Colwellia]MBU2925308.1 flagellar protein FlaG [Colwellia sp. C2M11]MDO6506966.1 flagellar protein FlaG [Colwellia sp. 5_MG-2023]MDO6556596.1 flagellar protein FlaG [Colwellia sp. 4_MG-2023]MDO6651167.1 flagellar protein FlaG [Colwellia sp. 3_MG-2023]MDO6664410.1 flagellar protein FlaG [Colwellia sp. 2_MG-2023]